MRHLHFRNGDDAFSPGQIEEMQERLATLERLSTNQQHRLVEQESEMLHLRAILLAVGRELPGLDELPTVPLMPALRSLSAVQPQPAATPAVPSTTVVSTPAARAESVSPPAGQQPDAPAQPHPHLQTSRRALLKWGSAAAAASVAAAATTVLHEAPTANAAGVQWQTGAVSADAETVVKPASAAYADNDILQLQQGTGTPFQPAPLKTALAAYDTTGGGIGVYATSSGGTGLYGVTDTGTGAQGDAGLYAKALSKGTGVAGSSGSGIGVQGNSNTGIGGSFTGGLAPLSLGLGATVGAPTGGAHTPGEIYLDNQANVYVCVAAGSPGTWQKLGIGSGLTFLPAPFRFIDTRGGTGTPYSGSGPWPAFSVSTAQIGGLNGVPAGAKGFFGNVTVTGTTGSGFLTLYPTGGAVPNTSTINYVGGQTIANACIVGLNSSGQLNIKVFNSNTQVILDVAGYIL